MMKTFRITTFGCRVNQAESRTIGAAIVKLLNCQIANSYEKADLVILNTCCVTNKAEKEVRKEIRRVKRENPDCFLVVCGCWVNNIKNRQSKASELLKLIDLLIENKDKEKIAEILKEKLAIRTNTTITTTKKFYKDKYSKSKKALIKIQDGCDNFCSYCIVPYVRGRSKSRSLNKIVKEVKKLVEQEIEEVILTGIDISDYKPSLVRLIRLILAETEIKKISFGSIGLDIFDDEFIKVCCLPRLTKHFHIPLQSGCNETLKRMGRKYTVEKFKSQISKLKANIPEFTFSTDIIVGFPGESKEEFSETRKTLKRLETILGKSFKKIHVFRFSAKKGTVAAKKELDWGKVDEKEKKKRVKDLYSACFHQLEETIGQVEL